jgi:hypothetical protein
MTACGIAQVFNPRQRLCREPETPSAKPTAPSRNVNVDVVFAESRAGRLSAKTIYFLKKKCLCREPVRLALGKGGLCREPYRQALGKDFFLKKKSLPRACQAGSRQRGSLPRAIQIGSRQRLFIFFKKNLGRTSSARGGFENLQKNRQHIYDTKATHPSKF